MRFFFLLLTLAGRSSADGDWWCTQSAPKNHCGACGVEADCGGDDITTDYCKQAREPACGPAPPKPPPAPAPPPAGTCTKEAPQNSCNGCDTEDDCGNGDGNADKYYCQKTKDPQCGSPGPQPPPGPAAGTCTKHAPANSCGGCSIESECGGNDGTTFCQKAKDPQCNGGQAAFCVKNAPKNGCGGCSIEAECGGSDGTTFCQVGKPWNCGGPSPGPKIGFCAHWAKQNSCQPCSADGECGSAQNSCWGVKDAACPHSDAEVIV